MYKEQAVGKLDAREELLAVWTLCRLTRAPLGGADGRQQVVLCPLGCMYDREAVLTALKERSLDGIPLPPLVAHIKSLKSLTTLQMHLSDPPAADTAAAAAAAADFREPRAEHVRFSCPLTGLQMNGRYRFVALCPSGVVVSERALKSAPAAVEDMLAGASLASQQQIPIYGTPEEVDALRAALAAKAAAASNGKGKRKAEAAPAEAPPPPPPPPQAVRKAGVAPAAPAGATKEVWNSLFTSSGPAAKVETFGARNVSARR
jgi:Rtf2 RING-finger